MSKTKKVAIFTGPEGHLSIAEAISSYLESDYQVSTFYDRDNLFAIYTPIYQYLPVAHKMPYTLAKWKSARRMLQEFFRQKYYEKIGGFLDKEKPDICISTIYMFNPGLEQVCTERSIPLINIISDPVTIHPLLVSESASTNLVFDEAAQKVVAELFPKAKTDISGWFVRPRFNQAFSTPKVRRQLKLDLDLPTILITAGSEGTAMILKIAPALFALDTPSQIVVTCGHNQQLLKSMKALGRMLENRELGSKLLPIGFTDHVEQYMAAADLVIGKAGPNTIFETAATLTPFLATTHVSGQEDGNLDLIKNYHLGIVQENPLKAIGIIKDLIKDQEQLAAFKPALEKMARYNQQAEHVLKKVIKNSL